MYLCACICPSCGSSGFWSLDCSFLTWSFCDVIWPQQQQQHHQIIRDGCDCLWMPRGMRESMCVCHLCVRQTRTFFSLSQRENFLPKSWQSTDCRLFLPAQQQSQYAVVEMTTLFCQSLWCFPKQDTFLGFECLMRTDIDAFRTLGARLPKIQKEEHLEKYCFENPQLMLYSKNLSKLIFFDENIFQS